MTHDPHTLSLSTGIWEEIIDETEMDATDLHTLSKRLSFRMIPELRAGDSSVDTRYANAATAATDTAHYYCYRIIP